MATLNWIGKEAVVNHDKDVPFRLLEKVPAASIGKESKNLIIHGDNLEVLKALMPFYKGMVKCIYIDPPYNTGSDGWAYNDRVDSPKMREWLEQEVKKDDLTRHDKWLCMMYPRLKLLRELLKDDGSIFISIDDNEQHRLRELMDEIFGAKNFIELFSWVKTETPSNLSNKTKKNTEYVLCYEKHKNSNRYKGINRNSESSNGLLNQTNSTKRLVFPANLVLTNIKNKKLLPGKYGTAKYNVVLLSETEVRNGVFTKPILLEAKFKWVQSKLDEEIAAGTKILIPTERFSPAYERKEYKPEVPSNLLDSNDGVGTNEDASAMLEDLGFSAKDFQYPKPISLVSYLINMVTEDADIVLDSFAGSGTTGHAVLDLNTSSKNKRRFILVEMEDAIAKRVTAERIKRAIKKYKYQDGFEYCELTKPLFNEKGQINETCSYSELASYIYFTETRSNLNNKVVEEPFIGESAGVSYYLLFKEKNKNDLTRGRLSKLNIKGSAVVYADRCLVDEDELRTKGIIFKQIPYEIKVY